MEYKSNCCDATPVVKGEITHYYVCSYCGKPCDVHHDSSMMEDVIDAGIGIVAAEILDNLIDNSVDSSDCPTQADQFEDFGGGESGGAGASDDY